MTRWKPNSTLFELTFAPDGRALFGYGEPVRDGERHVIWLDIGGHEILR